VPSLSYDVLFFLVDPINSNPRLAVSVEFASTVTLVGFLLKLGAAPLHQWVADVYTGAHLFITALFATAVKLVLFVVFCRIAYQFSGGSLISFFAVSSLVVGTFLTIKQTEIKRFLAYSSIVHVGFLLIGDLSSGFVYVFTYILSSLLFFSVILTVQNSSSKEPVYLTDLRVLKRGGN